MSLFARKLDDLFLYDCHAFVDALGSDTRNLEKFTKLAVKAVIYRKVEEKAPKELEHLEELATYCMKLHKESLGNPGALVLAEQISAFLVSGATHVDILSMPTEDYLKEMRRVFYGNS